MKTLSISIKKQQVLDVVVAEDNGCEEYPLVSCSVSSMKPDPEAESFEGKLCIELNKNGLVEFKNIEMSQKITVEEKVPIKKEKKKEVKKLEETPKEDEDTKMQVEEEENEENKMEIEEEQFEIKKKEKTLISELKSRRETLIGLT